MIQTWGLVKLDVPQRSRSRVDSVACFEWRTVIVSETIIAIVMLQAATVIPTT